MLQKRTIPDAEQRLYDDLRWAGLHWDEGAEDNLCGKELSWLDD